MKAEEGWTECAILKCSFLRHARKKCLSFWSFIEKLFFRCGSLTLLFIKLQLLNRKNISKKIMKNASSNCVFCFLTFDSKMFRYFCVQACREEIILCEVKDLVVSLLESTKGICVACKMKLKMYSNLVQLEKFCK